MTRQLNCPICPPTQISDTETLLSASAIEIGVVCTNWDDVRYSSEIVACQGKVSWLSSCNVGDGNLSFLLWVAILPCDQLDYSSDRRFATNEEHASAMLFRFEYPRQYSAFEFRLLRNGKVWESREPKSGRTATAQNGNTERYASFK